MELFFEVRAVFYPFKNVFSFSRRDDIKAVILYDNVSVSLSVPPHNVMN